MVRRISRDEASLDVLIEAVEAIDEPIIVDEDGKARLVAMSPQHFERLRGEGIVSELAAHEENQQGR